ncbi:MAG: BRCT domain-containing protein [Longimicrobiales bacterium]
MQLDDDSRTAPWVNVSNRARRAVSDLVSIAGGMLADGTITSSEVHGLVSWIAAHPALMNTFPGNIIGQRLERYLADQYIDEDEIADLSNLLRELTGNVGGTQNGFTGFTTLPLTRPAPFIEFAHREFVFTGKFFYGPRKACEHAVAERGGSCSDEPRSTTNYVVIGTLGSPVWSESPSANKIKTAITMKTKGAGIIIVSEDHWAGHL